MKNSFKSNYDYISCPAGRLRRRDIVFTSMRCDYVAATSKRSHYDVMRLLEENVNRCICTEGSGDTVRGRNSVLFFLDVLSKRGPTRLSKKTSHLTGELVNINFRLL